MYKNIKLYVLDPIQGIYLYITSICLSTVIKQVYYCNKFKKTRRRLLLCSEVDRARFTIHNTISAPNVSPHVPPPFTASTCGEQRQLALERRDVNTSDQELLTPL